MRGLSQARSRGGTDRRSSDEEDNGASLWSSQPLVSQIGANAARDPAAPRQMVTFPRPPSHRLTPRIAARRDDNDVTSDHAQRRA